MLGLTNEDPKVQVDQAIAEMQSVGFTILRGFVDEQRVESLKRLSDEVFKPESARASDRSSVEAYTRKSLLVQTREIDDLVTDQRLLSIAKGVLLKGPDYYRRIRTAAAGFKDAAPGGEDVRSLHRDGAIYPVRMPGKPLVVNSLLAIDEFTPEGGATTFVPGSHLWDKEVDPDHPVVAIEMNPGDLAVFGGEVWHGHGPNQTSHRRRCLSLLYVSGWLQPFNNLRAAFSVEQLADLPEELVDLI